MTKTTIKNNTKILLKGTVEFSALNGYPVSQLGTQFKDAYKNEKTYLLTLSNVKFKDYEDTNKIELTDLVKTKIYKDKLYLENKYQQPKGLELDTGEEHIENLKQGAEVIAVVRAFTSEKYGTTSLILDSVQYTSDAVFSIEDTQEKWND